MARRLLAICCWWFVSAQAVTASAALQIAGYDPLQHDRFVDHPDFIGRQYDWSGVGSNAAGSWATLVSPSFAITATHASPAVGSHLRFYATNDPAGPFIERQVIGVTPVVQDGQSSQSDLSLAQLGSPATGVAFYPILTLASPADYIGQELYVFGRSTSAQVQSSVRLGRNRIADVWTVFSHPSLGSSVGDTFIYDYDPVGGVGADEARVQDGDSGGPSFVVASGGVPAVVGIHWFKYSASPDGFDGSGDTLVSSFVDEMNRLMAATGSAERLLTVSAVPEPSSWILVAGATACLFSLRRRRPPGTL